MKKTSIAIAALAIIQSSLTAQHYTNVTVLDSKSPAPIANAVVVELGSGQVAITDSDGEGVFLTPFSGTGTLKFEVTAAGFPDHYFERLTPDFGQNLESTTTLELKLTNENEFISPILGSAGGSKSVTIPTGIWVYLDENDTDPVEYNQALSATISAGSLSGNYRMGLSVIPGAQLTENNMNVTDLGDRRQIVSQFRLNWLSTTGLPIADPVLAQPIRIEMGAATYFFDEVLPGSWQVSLYKFDDSSLTWAPVSGASGVDANGLLWADVSESGEFSFMAWNAALPSAAPCTPEWYTEDWVGPDKVTETLVCPPTGQPGGTQTSGSADITDTSGTKVSNDLSADLSGPLGLIGFSAGASTDSETSWSTSMKVGLSYPAGAWPGMQGKVSINEIGYMLVNRTICWDMEGEETANIINSQLGPFKTGLAVFTNLIACF